MCVNAQFNKKCRERTRHTTVLRDLSPTRIMRMSHAYLVLRDGFISTQTNKFPALRNLLKIWVHVDCDSHYCADPELLGR